MSRHTKSEIWRYFEYVNLDSAKCNKCGKCYSRKGRTTTSLKNHLRSSHPQEFLDFLGKDMARLENKGSPQMCDILKANPIEKPQHSLSINEDVTSATSTSIGCGNLLFESNEQKNNLYGINSRTLNSNDSYSRDSILLSPTIIKQEVFIEPENVQASNLSETISQNNLTTKETERQIIYNQKDHEKNLSLIPDSIIQTKTEPEDPLDVPILNEDDELEEPLPKMIREISGEYLNEPTYEFEALQNQHCTKDPQGMCPDNADKSSIPSEDNFERWLKKRKQTLEVEYQEMINYEMKLKIFEKEQQLQLPRSKFTKNIGA